MKEMETQIRAPRIVWESTLRVFKVQNAYIPNEIIDFATILVKEICKHLDCRVQDFIYSPNSFVDEKKVLVVFFFIKFSSSFALRFIFVLFMFNKRQVFDIINNHPLCINNPRKFIYRQLFNTIDYKLSSHPRFSKYKNEDNLMTNWRSIYLDLRDEPEVVKLKKNTTPRPTPSFIGKLEHGDFPKLSDLEYVQTKWEASIKAICCVSGFTIDKIFGKSRKIEYVDARTPVFWFAYKYNMLPGNKQLSFPVLGKRLGRTHSDVYLYCQRHIDFISLGVDKLYIDFFQRVLVLMEDILTAEEKEYIKSIPDSKKISK